MSDLSYASWTDLTESQPHHTKTWIERNQITPMCDYDFQRWLDEGVMEIDLSADPEFLKLIDRYAEARAQLPKDPDARTNYWHGWHFPTPYLVCPQMLSLGLCEQLVEPLNVLLNENALLHLALTGWVSTERNWHQDSYLNPPPVWSHYVAAWIALDDIDRDAGPFQYVPGSHRWEVLRRDKLFRFLDPSVSGSPDWPSMTQDEIAVICEKKIREMGVEPVYYTPKKGKVLIWHSNLMHRGTRPLNPDLLRKALILHYSGVSVRTDMNPVKRFDRGFFFEGPVDGSTRMMK